MRAKFKVPRKRVFKKKRSLFKKRFKRKRVFLAKPVSSEWQASCVTTQLFEDQGTNSGAPYNHSFSFTSGGNYPTTAFQLMQGFRFYRAAKVEWIYEPNWTEWNGALSGTAGGTTAPASAPYMYFKMDRTQMNPWNSTIGPGLNTLQSAGAKPRLFNKKISITYVPNVVYSLDEKEYTSDFQGTGQMGPKAFVPKMEKPGAWVNTIELDEAGTATQGNTAEWGGHVVGWDQSVATAATYTGLARVTCHVHWQFKDPMQFNNGLNGGGDARRASKAKPRVVAAISDATVG